MGGGLLPATNGNNFDAEFLIALFAIFSFTFLMVYLGVPLIANAFFR